jgi:hypothetical protein
MIMKKRGRRSSENTEDRDKIMLETREAAEIIRGLIRSTSMNSEEKIAVEDAINNLANDVESMLDRIGMASTAENQRRLLIAYKKFLQHNVEAVNQRLKDID